MMVFGKILWIWTLLFFLAYQACATDYYFHPIVGDNAYSGTALHMAFRSLDKIKELQLGPGDVINLAGGHVFEEGLILENVRGTIGHEIIVRSYSWGVGIPLEPAQIISRDSGDGIVIRNCSFVIIENIDIQAQGANPLLSEELMRCGVLVIATAPGVYQGITLRELEVRDIYYNESGVSRNMAEVRSANGTQKYGWGIRFIVDDEHGYLNDLAVENCIIQNVAHTGLKFTAPFGKINNIYVRNNQIIATGGPGVQMSGVSFGYVSDNLISHSGSTDDSRKWGRGSGLWTWNSSDILIEKNRFEYANGPGDSAGCHIDFKCRNVVVQYNMSVGNAGGFCEILGDNYNCCYRYNISVNDGHRIKGKNDAFQEGKTFWLSGYNSKEASGPYNSYFYNNTIFVHDSIVSKVAIASVADGILIANNIFYIMGKSRLVQGDQYIAENDDLSMIKDIYFENNLYSSIGSWPEEFVLQDGSPIYGNPHFQKNGGLHVEDFIPYNIDLIKNKGVVVSQLENDSLGLSIGINAQHDIMGNPIIGLPDIGAIEIDGLVRKE